MQLVFGLIVVAAAAMASNRIRFDNVALLVVLALMLSDVLTVGESLAEAKLESDFGVRVLGMRREQGPVEDYRDTKLLTYVATLLIAPLIFPYHG